MVIGWLSDNSVTLFGPLAMACVSGVAHLINEYRRLQQYVYRALIEVSLTEKN